MSWIKIVTTTIKPYWITFSRGILVSFPRILFNPITEMEKDSRDIVRAGTSKWYSIENNSHFNKGDFSVWIRPFWCPGYTNYVTMLFFFSWLNYPSFNIYQFRVLYVVHSNSYTFVESQTFPFILFTALLRQSYHLLGFYNMFTYHTSPC